MKIKDKEYHLRNLNTFEHFELARKLAPVLTLLSMQKDKALLKQGFAQSFVSLVGELRKEDMDIVLATCLTGVTREDQNGGVQPIYVSGQLMFTDIDLNTMMDIIWEVLLKARLLDFFAARPSNSTEGQVGQTSTGSDSQTAKVG